MKATSRGLLAFSLFFVLAALPAAAQQKQAQDADLLRTKIEQFEKTDISSKSSSVQAIYQRTLLRLYNEFNSALLQDISELKAMQDVVNGTDTGSQKDIVLELQKLTREQDELAEKIKTLSGDLQTASAAPAPAEHRPSQPAAVPADFATGRGAASAGELVASAGPAADQSSRVRVVSTPAATDALPTPQESPTPEPPRLNTQYLREGTTLLTGTTSTHGRKVQIKINDEDVGTVNSDGRNGFFTKVVPELRENDRVELVEMAADGTTAASDPGIYRVRSEVIPLQKGGPVGILVGGAVFSQQGDQFNQSDPFFGFIAGYSSYVRGGRDFPRDFDGNPLDRDGRAMRRCTQEDALIFNCKVGHYYLLTANRVGNLTYQLDKDGNPVETRPGLRQANRWRWNVRFQGIFTANGRTAQATETADTTGGATATPADNIKFIASRQTFDVETHTWIDFFPLNLFSIGPYAAWGASTVMDKNELADEPTQVSDAETGGTATPAIVTQAKSDDDIKQYQEVGALMNLMLFDKKLFIQTILAYGHYEAFKDLHGENQSGFGDDSTHRFVGKLRIFPGGLNRSFNKQIDAAPMFGVDLNAGPGPDYLKFFVGYAIRIGGIKGVPGIQ
ncbi:MAG TPA: hypothetical protein VGC87_04940 [Pyrinomonadaceae bacterium]|jgi:hypothetical protein